MSHRSGAAVWAAGWATVELERAEHELGSLLAPGATFEDAADSTLLGARCRIGRTTGSDAPAPVVALLEPVSEGRIAATLARHGEGWCATWEPARDADASASDPRPGPFGAERLVRGGAIGGPHRLLLEAATIGVMSEPTLVIRPAVIADADVIAALFTDEGFPAGPTDIVERLGRFSSAHSQVLVAEHDGAMLGFVALHAMPRFEHDDRIVRILALVVDAGARERGVGRALLAEAERIAGDLGAAFIEVTAGHHRPEARRLYESSGYDASVAAYLRKKL